MANPSLLFWDSDALIQLLLTNTIAPLRALRSDYGIQSVVVPEVEIEMLSPKRFGSIAPELRKAIGNNLIKVFDESTFLDLLGRNDTLRADAAGTSFADIQQRGRAYSARVDVGEAYTFAAALELRQPAASHDWNAIKTLIALQLPLPFSVLRAFDLVVFAHQIALMSEKDCDRFRKALVQNGEGMPRSQQGKSFRDGLAQFEPRLIDSTRAIVGIPPLKGGPVRYNSPLYIVPTPRPPSLVEHVGINKK